MEDMLSFENILDPAEINDLFSGEEPTPPKNNEETKPGDTKGGEEDNDIIKENEITDVPIEELFGGTQESVGNEDNKKEGKETPPPEKKGDSSSFYSSIAKALKEDGVFPDLDDDSVKGSDSAEKFRELIDKQVEARLNETQKRINDALNAGIEPDSIRNYEMMMQQLNSITMDKLKAEGDEGEALRKDLILRECKLRGLSDEKAKKELEKSLQTGNDIDDAIDALNSIKARVKGSYDAAVSKAKEEQNKVIEETNKGAEALKKSILEDKTFFGDLEIDNSMRKKVWDNMTVARHKTEDGNYITEIQKYQKEHPADFFKNIGLLYTLTDGFTNIDKIVGRKVKKEVGKSLKELENVINGTSRNPDGSFNFVSSGDKNANFNKDNWQIDLSVF